MAVLVAVADDFTGASDQAGMLAGAGCSSLLVLDESFPLDASEWEAITYATRLRSLPVAEARRTAPDLFRKARALCPQMIQYKYCSTFDSTPEGNIGPVLDVALDLTGARGTVVVPALPVNGRTTYQGQHFVLGVPLAESPMRDHPRNPMTDSSLVRWLQQQTKRQVGLMNYATVEGGPEAIRRELETLWAAGQPYVVVDCLDQRHVRAIARAVADLPLVSGSSALPMELPALWRRQGLLGPRRRVREPRKVATTRQVLALAGSCAAQTLRQLGCAEGFEKLPVNVHALLECEAREQAGALLSEIRRAFEQHDRVLVSTSQWPEERATSLARAQAAGLSAREFGLRIECLLAQLAVLAAQELGVRRLVVAGGETSGAVCQALGLQAVEILREIAPGVPLCRSLPDRRMVIALKSGNFGGDRFFDEAAGLAEAS